MFVTDEMSERSVRAVLSLDPLWGEMQVEVVVKKVGVRF